MVSLRHKTFLADDKFVDVVRCLQDRGWERCKAAGMQDCQLLWCNLRQLKFRAVSNDQFVNHLQNAQQLSNKANLTGHLRFFDDMGSPITQSQTTRTSTPFYPRCWDLTADNPHTLVTDFAVGAAAAVLQHFSTSGQGTPATSESTKADPSITEAALLLLRHHTRTLRHERARALPASPPTPPAAESPTTRHAAAQLLLEWAEARSAIPGHCKEEPCLPLPSSISRSPGPLDSRHPPKDGARQAAPTSSTQRFGQGGSGLTFSALNGPLPSDGAAVAACRQAHRASDGLATAPSAADGEIPAASVAGPAEEAAGVLEALRELDPALGLYVGAANAWILKPAGLSCGRGVQVFMSLRQLLAAAKQLNDKVVIQKYVERPLLVGGRKFDIRQWVLVTSVNPLVLWGFRECYLRFSGRAYTLSSGSLQDRFIHLCNYSVQKESGVEPEEGAEGMMWRGSQLAELLMQQHGDQDVYKDAILPQIRHAVVQTLSAVQETLRKSGRGFEWLGFDVMLTDDLRVVLLEVNTSPDVSHSTPVTAALLPHATEDALCLLLDEGHALPLSASKRATWPPVCRRRIDPGLYNPPEQEVQITGGVRVDGAKESAAWCLWHWGQSKHYEHLDAVRRAKRQWDFTRASVQGSLPG